MKRKKKTLVSALTDKAIMDVDFIHSFALQKLGGGLTPATQYFSARFVDFCYPTISSVERQGLLALDVGVLESFWQLFWLKEIDL